jgi:tetratricopeptide (TPR) repeat protein
VTAELVGVAGDRRAPKLEQQLMEAAHAYERERYQDAARMLRRLADVAPGSAAVRELHGLALYRVSRYAAAARELEAYRALSGEVDQHPVLADCYRAMRRWKKADELWTELRETSPSADLVAEGRLVAAGAKADRGDLRAAIALLEGGKPPKGKPKDRHVRTWYALADLYERAGEVPKALALFRRVVAVDAGFADAAERAASLA